MDDRHRFKLKMKFWGVRGSTPTPQIENLGHGGNTSCLEIRLPTGEIFIFDGGTGVRTLGLSLLDEFRGRTIRASFFLTHYHWDHIQGIPFFGPLYGKDNEFTFHSFPSTFPDARGEERGRLIGVEEMLEGQMKNPYFPVNLAFLPSRRKFVEIDRQPVNQGAASIHPFPMNHPQGARGYRIESNGAVIVYATDVEHGDRQLDGVLREHCQNADVLIYDAQYTPDEYNQHIGWGHSTWEEAIRVARDSGVEQLVLFHHDPARTDQMMFEIVERARRHFPNTSAAKEGAVLIL